MRHFSLLTLSCLLFSGLSAAQTAVNRTAPPPLTTYQDEVNRLEHEIMAQSALDSKPETLAQSEARLESEYRRRVFYEKAKRFVSLWKNFTEELNDRQTVNVKLAKKVSKAFHELESSEGWPAAKELSSRAK